MTVTALGAARRKKASSGAYDRSPLPASVLTTFFLFCMSVYFLGPVVWLGIASTKTLGDLGDSNPFGFGHTFALGQNLSRLFSRDGGVFAEWLVNSALYSVLGSAAATLLAASAGYVFSKHRFTGREGLFSVVMAGVLVPTTALAIPIYVLFSKWGLTNTRFGVFLPAVVSPFGVYLARIYITSAVPDEMLEAARLDGAGEVRIFFTIVLRVISPALVTIFLFQLVAVWNNFLLPLVMLSNQHLYPVTLGLFAWSSQLEHYPDLTTLIITGSLVSVLPLIVAFLLLQRYWRAGLTSGSVK